MEINAFMTPHAVHIGDDCIHILGGMKYRDDMLSAVFEKHVNWYMY